MTDKDFDLLVNIMVSIDGESTYKTETTLDYNNNLKKDYDGIPTHLMLALIAELNRVLAKLIDASGITEEEYKQFIKDRELVSEEEETPMIDAIQSIFKNDDETEENM